MAMSRMRSLDECIRECARCADLCLKTARHCLSLGGEHAAPEHQTLLQDCADVCGLAARAMSRSSERHTHFCALCAEVCDACAEDCERLARPSDIMAQCAEACRTCAESCRRMAGAAA